MPGHRPDWAPSASSTTEWAPSIGTDSSSSSNQLPNSRALPSLLGRDVLDNFRLTVSRRESLDQPG